VKHPELIKEWHSQSNYLVIVAVQDENALIELCRKARTHGLIHNRIREPDYNDELTALALEPGDAARRLCSQYPLALREKAMV